MPGCLVLDTEFNPRPFRLISVGFVRLGKYGEVRDSKYFLIRPSGFVINEHSPAYAVHKISQKHASEHGVPIEHMLEWLASVLPCTTCLVGHNVKRDIQLLREEAQRWGRSCYCCCVAKILGRLPVHDTMLMAKAKGMKPLSLEAVHSALFGKAPVTTTAEQQQQLHHALVDAKYTADVYNELLEQQQQQDHQQSSIHAFFSAPS